MFPGGLQRVKLSEMYLSCLGELRQYQEAEARPLEVDPPLESEGPEALVGECVRFFIFISGTPCNRQRDVAEPQLFTKLHEHEVQRVLCT